MIRNSIVKIVCLLLIVGLNWTGLSAIGRTSAYFFDSEGCNINTFHSAILDFSIPPVPDFSPIATPDQNSSRTIQLKNDGNLDFEYRVKVENATGTLCDYLLLKDDLTGGFQPLSNFVSPTTTFSNKSDWQFEAKLNSSEPSLQNKTCAFDFVFDGWQTGGAGFSDQEAISNTVLSGIWQKVLINKVYYDVDSAHGAEPANEWIELYNPLSHSLDISGWAIEDNNGIDIIPASSPIPAKGFAVITASSTTWNYWEIPDDVVRIVLADGRIGNGLNNDADMLALRDNYGNIVDQMNWATPNPDWPNYNSNIWNPGCFDVDENHMLARVPTGYDTNTASDFHDLTIPQVAVLVPSGGEVWYVGRTYTLEWSAVNPNGSDSDLSIDIWYSRDSGSTWANIARGTENDGQYDWRIPLFINGYYVPSDHARIKIVAFGSENFMIQGWSQSNDFCPPIDYSQLTEEEKAEVEILLAQGIISEDEIINRDGPVSTETEEGEADINPEESSTTDEAIPAYDAITTQTAPALSETTTTGATSSEDINTSLTKPDATTTEEATSTIADDEAVGDTASTDTDVNTTTTTTTTSNQTETADGAGEEAGGLTGEASADTSDETTTTEATTIEPTATEPITDESTTTEEAITSQETTTTETASAEEKATSTEEETTIAEEEKEAVTTADTTEASVEEEAVSPETETETAETDGTNVEQEQSSGAEEAGTDIDYDSTAEQAKAEEQTEPAQPSIQGEESSGNSNSSSSETVSN